MTIDRYHAIVNAVRSMNWRSRRASSIVCLSVWAVSLLISLPFALFHGTMDVMEFGEKLTYCKEKWPSAEFGKVTEMLVICTTFVIPLVIIVVCYYQIVRNLWTRSRQEVKRQNDANNAATPLSGASQIRRRRKVTRMVAIVVLLFATFWFPIHVFNIYRILHPSYPRTTALYIFKIFGHTLSFANSCVNPFVYAFLNDAFKKAFSKTFPFISKLCPCARVTSDDRYTQVTGMVDQAIQAMPCDDVNGNGGTELVSISERKNSVCKNANSLNH
ncbi:hypothetical protein FSP39_024763 [Pinctada imbricata]|uniref:G-protein coupled receptors family 1 profile domain-containing protein n=1 Tax=Pinctada imbricata TaxID=66713 RepID=A0AA89CCA6_PINIB|nr:hypothetical protein FSP39_024763 [Pinctada imbricata]